MTEYESSTPSSISTFSSPGHHGVDSFQEGTKPQLYGPANLTPDVIMVPQSRNDNKTPTMQTREEEVKMLASVAELDLSMLDCWSHKDNMTWLKCMLTKHLPQPAPHEVEERLRVLKMVEKEIALNKLSTLEEFVRVFEKFENDFGMDIGMKLSKELTAWRQVRDDLLIRFLPDFPDSVDKGTGDHLWEHILRLLMKEDSTVEWLDKENGLFRFVDSSGAARSWGMTKGNRNMSYEKMSRSIRQYYTEGKNGIIQKAVEHPKLHYRFNMTHPDVVKFLQANFFETCLADKFMATIVKCE